MKMKERVLATIRVAGVERPGFRLPPMTIEAVCLPIPRGWMLDTGNDVFVPWDEMPPLPRTEFERLPDYAKLCAAWADTRVEYIPESQWSAALREEQRRLKYRGWRLWPYLSDRGELIVVTRVWTRYNDDPAVEDVRAKARALELYEGAAPCDPRIVPGERVEHPL